MERICLPRELFLEMIAHVAGQLPDEACGLLGGRDGRAMRHYPVENRLHTPTAYEMEPLQQVRAMLAIEAAELELVAIYHSHPAGPARPSPTDVAEARYPDATHIIIDLSDAARPAARAFMIREGRAREIGLVILARS
ncbi:MAG: M67 family metallopeptidase [Anaerolineae bacterium]|nr:M67 family metallopeptidase [Anaerolineae bacterium]